QGYVSYSNIAALMYLAEKPGWEIISELDNVKLWTHEEGDRLSLKVEMSMKVSSRLAFSFLSDFITCDLLEVVTEDEKIYHVTSPHVTGNKPKDFVILVSQKKPRKPSEPYIIAVKSVNLTSKPPSSEYCRGEILYAGFQIYSDSSSSCMATFLIHLFLFKQVYYFHKVTSSVKPYVAANLPGSPKSILDSALECKKFLE
ncbi:Acyl-coenzyme A thioesterase 12, partial [Colius striatus]